MHGSLRRYIIEETVGSLFYKGMCAKYQHVWITLSDCEWAEDGWLLVGGGN